MAKTDEEKAADAQAKKDAAAAIQQKPETPEAELKRLIDDRDSAPAKRRIIVVGDRTMSDWPGAHDQVLAAGTRLQLHGAEVVLQAQVPVECPEIRGEEVFVDHLVAAHPSNLAANAAYFVNRYNSNGAIIGLNDEHPVNVRNARIADLEKQNE